MYFKGAYILETMHLSSQNDRPTESLSRQMVNLAGHCAVSGHYFDPWNSNYRRTVINPAHQEKIFGLVEMTFWWAKASYTLSEWQAVKLTLFCTQYKFMHTVIKLVFSCFTLFSWKLLLHRPEIICNSLALKNFLFPWQLLGGLCNTCNAPLLNA